MLTDEFTIQIATSNDLDMILEWRNHPKTRIVMFNSKIITQQEHAQWFANIDELNPVIIVANKDEPIGVVHFKNFKKDSTTHWGFYKKPYSPKGTGSHIANAALHYAFNSVEVSKVVGEVLTTNLVSIHCHKKIGFRLEGIMHKSTSNTDFMLDAYVFGLSTNDWNAIL